MTKLVIKVCSYIAWYPILGTVQSTLHITHWQTCSFQHHLDFSGKHLAILHEDYLFVYLPLCVARYLFMQLSELWERGVKETAKASKWQKEDSNSGSLD